MSDHKRKPTHKRNDGTQNYTPVLERFSTRLTYADAPRTYAQQLEATIERYLVAKQEKNTQ